MSFGSSFIKGIIYTEVDEEYGTNPVVWMPSHLDIHTIMHVGIKSIALLSDEHGIIPNTLVFIPFPSVGIKSIIKYIQWKDDNRRSSTGYATLTFLFSEGDDMVMYKYINELEEYFAITAENLIKIEEMGRDKDLITRELQNLAMTIESTLDEFKIQEKQMVEQLIEFPDKLPENPETYQFKLVVCGDPMVGKTSLILKYVKRVFQRSYLPTLGVSVSSKVIQVEDAIVQLVLWDIAGQQKFQTMRTSFYNGARGVLLVFDLTRPETFQSMTNWYQDISSNLKGEPFLIGFIIGNKNDLSEARKVSNEEAIEVVSKLNLGYFETSALTGENVDNAFTSLAYKLLQESRKN